VERRINWGNVPQAPTVRTRAELISPRTTQGFRAVLTGETIVGVWTHYLDRRTIPCAGAGCFCQNGGVGSKWYGYCSCILEKTGGEYLLEFTRNAGQMLISLLESGDSCRGKTVFLRRRTNKLCSPVDASLIETVYSGHLPKGFDPVPVLLNIWNIHFRSEVHQPRRRRKIVDDLEALTVPHQVPTVGQLGETAEEIPQPKRKKGDGR
jgi:hypothetical protein